MTLDGAKDDAGGSVEDKVKEKFKAEVEGSVKDRAIGSFVGDV